MKITMWMRKIKTGSISEEHELRVGQYNEFYLPACDRDHELWVKVVDGDGVETLLHMKR